MSLSIKCTCGKTWAVSEALVGKRVKCKDCGAAVAVGKSSESIARKRSARKSADTEDEAFDDGDLVSSEARAPVRRKKVNTSQSSASLFDAAELWAVLTNPSPETFDSPYGKGLFGILTLAYSPIHFVVMSAWERSGGVIVVKKSQVGFFLLGPWGAIVFALAGAASIAWGIQQLATEPASARKRRNLKAEPLSQKTKILLFSIVPLLCLLSFVYLGGERPRRGVDLPPSSDAPATIPASTPVAAAPAVTATPSVASTEKEQPASLPSVSATVDTPIPSNPTDNPPAIPSPVVVTNTIPKRLTTKQVEKTTVQVIAVPVPTGQLRLAVGFPREQSFGTAFGMNPSGDSAIASSTRPGELLNVVDLKSKKLRAQFPKTNSRGTIQQMVVSGDGQKILVSTLEIPYRFITCDLTESKIVGEFTSSLQNASGIALSHDGAFACVFDFSRRVVVWETATGKILQEAQIKDAIPLLAVQFQQDGRNVVFVTSKGLLRLDVANATWQIDEMLSFASFASHAWAAESGTVAAVRNGLEIEVIDTAKSTVLWVIPADSSDPISECAVSADGRVVATRGLQGLKVWDVAAHKLLAKQSLPSATLRIVLSHDGARLLVASATSGLEFWDVPISRE